MSNLFAAQKAQLDDGAGNILGTSSNPVHVSFPGGGDGIWTLTGNNVTLSTGTNNVGIGTDSSPDYNLEITAATGVDPFGISSTLTTSGDYFIVKSGGNTGIGSTAPGAALDVNGTVRVFGNIGIGTSPVSNSLAILAANPQIKIISNSDSTYFTTYSENGINAIGSGQTFNIAMAGSSKIKIDGNGNVGIGSANPGQLLDVKGTVRINVGATNPIAFVQNASSPTFSGMSFIGSNSNATNTAIFGGGDANMYFQANGGGGFQFRPNGTTPVAEMIDSGGNVGIGTILTTTAGLSIMNGNVGIGTWKPGEGLEIDNGNVGINGAGLVPTAQLQVYGSPGIYAQSGVKTNVITGYTGGSTPLLIGGSGTAVDFNATLNVGIGSTLPGQALDVLGSVRINNGTYSHKWGAPIPVLSSCGGGSPTVKGTDNDFQITVGTTATACTATFGNPTYLDASCVVTNQSMSITSAMSYTVSATTIVISQAVGLSSDLLNVHCDLKTG